MWATVSGLLFPFLIVAVLGGVIAFFLFAHSGGKRFAETNADLKFESDLQQAISRANAGQAAPTWTPPKLPSSVIASIYAHRFIGTPTSPPTKPQRYEAGLRRMTWDYAREAPYIVAAALLSLRDAGLIGMSLEPRGKILDSFERVRVERTEQAVPTVEMPAVEGGLLLACLDLAHKRFLKSTEPSAHAVIREWIGIQDHPYKWVLDTATYQGRQLGLYEPAIKKRGANPPVFSMDHLAACEDQVAACVNRWEEFGFNEPELQQRLITEASFGINSVRPSSGAGP
jgi:hypothetical protein